MFNLFYIKTKLFPLTNHKKHSGWRDRHAFAGSFVKKVDSQYWVKYIWQTLETLVLTVAMLYFNNTNQNETSYVQCLFYNMAAGGHIYCSILISCIIISIKDGVNLKSVYKSSSSQTIIILTF